MVTFMLELKIENLVNTVGVYITSFDIVCSTHKLIHIFSMIISDWKGGLDQRVHQSNVCQQATKSNHFYGSMQGTMLKSSPPKITSQ
jgi:hypothetical protein